MGQITRSPKSTPKNHFSLKRGRRSTYNRVTALAKHIGKNQETLGYNFDTKSLESFCLERVKTAILFRRIPRSRVLSSSLDILVVHRREHALDWSKAPRLAVMAGAQQACGAAHPSCFLSWALDSAGRRGGWGGRRESHGHC